MADGALVRSSKVISYYAAGIRLAYVSCLYEASPLHLLVEACFQSPTYITRRRAGHLQHSHTALKNFLFYHAQRGVSGSILAILLAYLFELKRIYLHSCLITLYGATLAPWEVVGNRSFKVRIRIWGNILGACLAHATDSGDRIINHQRETNVSSSFPHSCVPSLPLGITHLVINKPNVLLSSYTRPTTLSAFVDIFRVST